MQVWAWVDMPSSSFDFNTCDPDIGDNHNFYNEYYEKGTNFLDLMNYPGKYIDYGDWIVEEPFSVESREATFDIELGYKYEEE
jgi:hypothetical protein